MRRIEISVVCALLFFSATGLVAQRTDGGGSIGSQAGAPAGRYAEPSGSFDDARQSILTWTPPALEAVARKAEVRNSFVLDRTMLGALLALMPDSDGQVRPAIRKLDAVSVHLYRFHNAGQIDSASLEEVRQAYQARGWTHLVSKGGTADSDSKKTDLWLTLDGMTVRGGAMMLVTPKSVSLVTFVGELNPLDVLHLRGHFGIPSVGDDALMKAR